MKSTARPPCRDRPASDRAAAKGVIHKNTAARKKSRLIKQLQERADLILESAERGRCLRAAPSFAFLAACRHIEPGPALPKTEWETAVMTPRRFQIPPASIVVPRFAALAALPLEAGHEVWGTTRSGEIRSIARYPGCLRLELTDESSVVAAVRATPRPTSTDSTC